MKTLNLLRKAAVSALLIFGAGLYCSAQVNMGVGPVISGSVQTSKLPDKAQKFIGKHFANIKIASAQKDYAENDYDVVLSNGTKLEFTSKGALKEIEASDNAVLPVTVVKSVLPKKTYDELTKKNLTGNVESIECNKKGYQVEFKHPKFDKANFDTEGVIINLIYED